MRTGGQGSRPGGAGAVLARNALANVARVGSTAFVALVLPLVLALVMGHARYGVWALLFGVAALAQYFDFGIPVAVQALVSRGADGARHAPARILGSGIAWSTATGLLLIVAAAGLALNLHRAFPAVGQTAAAAGIALVLIVAGNAASLIGNTAAAYFLGVHRAWRAAVLLVPARVLSLALTATLAAFGVDLPVLAAAYALPLLLATLVIGADAVRAAGPIAEADAPRRLRELLDPAIVRFSGPLVVWSVGMVLINGVGVVVVGRFDFAALPLFSIVAALGTAVAGLQSALIAPVLSELGRRFASGDRRSADELVLMGTGFNSAVLAIATAASLALLPWVDRVVLAGRYASEPLLLLLVPLGVIGAVSIRLTMTPMTYAFIASATHSRIVAPPVVEAVATVLLVVAGGAAGGIVGASFGLLLGAVVGVTLALAWSRRISGAVGVGWRQLVARALLLPALLLSPSLLLTALQALRPGGATSAAALAAVVVSAVLLLRFSTPPALRAAVLDKLGVRPRERRERLVSEGSA